MRPHAHQDFAAVVTIVLLVVMFAGIDRRRGPADRIAHRPQAQSGSAATRGHHALRRCAGHGSRRRARRCATSPSRSTHFGTQRIGLTSPNRRVVPLTRDYQYVKATFSDYARPADQGDGLPAFAPPTSYDDYAESVEDLLALCVTGFPDFNQSSDATPFADLHRSGATAHRR